MVIVVDAMHSDRCLLADAHIYAHPGGLLYDTLPIPCRSDRCISAFVLTRYLQGWDVQGGIVAPAELASAFPHSTLLPGLQFALAGIIGKPVAFYVVPAVRFMFELLSYL